MREWTTIVRSRPRLLLESVGDAISGAASFRPLITPLPLGL